MRLHGALQWIVISLRVYFRLMLNVPSIDHESTMTLTRIKQSQKVNELHGVLTIEYQSKMYDIVSL